jgi:hypothetical protein
MKHALTLQTALFDHLRADAPLTAALGGPRVYDAPPPYITIGDESITAWDTKTEEGAAHELTFTIWSAMRGFSQIKTIQSALADALASAPTLPDARIAELRFVSSETSRERRTRLRRADCTYRALVEWGEAA